MAKNNHKPSLFDRAMRLADRFFDVMNKFKKIAAQAEKENIDFLDQKIPGYKASFEKSMHSASQLGSRLEAKAERIIFAKDLYLGAGGEARKAETERNSADQDHSAILEGQNAFSADVEGFNEAPAAGLPAGWKWIDYNDGSGYLASPEGKGYFSYDLAPYCTSGGIEFKATTDYGWDVFEGSLSAFKEYAEIAVAKDHLHEKQAFESHSQEREEISCQASLRDQDRQHEQKTLLNETIMTKIQSAESRSKKIQAKKHEETKTAFVSER